MTDTLPVQDEFAILSSSNLVDEGRSHVLKEGDTFAVFNRYGDIYAAGNNQQGLFHEGTRFISDFRILINQQPPLLLSSMLTSDARFLNIDLTNQDLLQDGHIRVPRGTVHLFRSKCLWKGASYDRLRLANYGLVPLDISLDIRIDGDFVDIFEVRGATRAHRGQRLDPDYSDQTLVLAYQGLDHVLRRVRISCSESDSHFSKRTLHIVRHLDVKEEATLDVICACETASRPMMVRSYDTAVQNLGAIIKTAQSRDGSIDSSHPGLNAWIHRSEADVHLMTTETRYGPYPYAGVPWFNTVFGRDGLWTAYFTLSTQPELARGVLSFLAAYQAEDTRPERDAEPGKIVHEMRDGEMAALNEIPFGRYYGSIDATPLFVFLAGAYYERTGDLDLMRQLWPHIRAALRWVDQDGDRDGDGFVEYFRQTPHGLAQQGWKDSFDSIFHRSGALAEGPIALCEVQAYVYGAKQAAATIARALGHAEVSTRLLKEARALQQRFEETFWSPELSTYALALDGRKRRCEVRTSNAGHCLAMGIASPERARMVARTLLESSSFSGWGIRTVDAREVRYNPMSYHDGSIWPHDNAIIALGFDRYGFKEEVDKVFQAILDASSYIELRRLPELYCGFHRRTAESPTLYPVACSPQAWASASVFALVQALTGLRIRAVPKPEVRLAAPRLPDFLEELVLKDLPVGRDRLTLHLLRDGQKVRLIPSSFLVPVFIDEAVS